ncbi:MAG: type II secretion system protein [Lachnospiraceae bacterium]|nr:type II secretion system protein [Lachnospiraceae bacterium]
MKNKGQTMIEVMVGFAVLGILTVMFSDILLFSGKTVAKTEKLMEEGSYFYEKYYLGEGIRKEKAGGGTVVCYRIDEEGKADCQDFFLLEEMNVYQYTDTEGGFGQVYDVVPEEETKEYDEIQ